jgi:hypothetical protein
MRPAALLSRLCGRALTYHKEYKVGVSVFIRETGHARHSANFSEIDDYIATARDNIRELIEQATACSRAAEDDLVAPCIAVQEGLLALPTKRRGELLPRTQEK